nr:DUF624 domain-containing protein [Lachnoclostridium phocaeense]
MEHIFDINGKFFSMFTRLADIILLNILFIISCLPIVTVGTALCALYQTAMQITEHTESYIHQDFFRNLKQGLYPNGLAGLLSTGCVCICVLNLRTLPFLHKGSAGIVLFWLQLLFLFCLYVFLLYISILPKPYRRTLKNALRNVFYLAFKHLPTSLVCLCISLLPVGCFLLFPGEVKWILSFLLTVGFSLISLAHSFLLLKALKRESIEL